jgi:hypothetical protein
MLFTNLILGAKFTNHSEVVLHSDDEAEVNVVQKLAGTKVLQTASLINGLRIVVVSYLRVTRVGFTIPEC